MTVGAPLSDLKIQNIKEAFRPLLCFPTNPLFDPAAQADWDNRVSAGDVEVTGNTLEHAIDGIDGNLAIDPDITIISRWCFTYAGSLTSLTFPRALETLGYDSFAYPSEECRFVYPGTVAEWNNVNVDPEWCNISVGCGFIVTIHCLDGTVEYGTCHDYDDDGVCKICGGSGGFIH